MFNKEDLSHTIVYSLYSFHFCLFLKGDLIHSTMKEWISKKLRDVDEGLVGSIKRI